MEAGASAATLVQALRQKRSGLRRRWPWRLRVGSPAAAAIFVPTPPLPRHGATQGGPPFSILSLKSGIGKPALRMCHIGATDDADIENLWMHGERLGVGFKCHYCKKGI